MLTDLPNEILLDIITAILFLEDDGNRSSVANLRLVSRKLRDAATPYAFHTVWLHKSIADATAQLDGLCVSGIAAAHVREVLLSHDVMPSYHEEKQLVGSGGEAEGAGEDAIMQEVKRRFKPQPDSPQPIDSTYDFLSSFWRFISLSCSNLTAIRRTKYNIRRYTDHVDLVSIMLFNIFEAFRFPRLRTLEAWIRGGKCDFERVVSTLQSRGTVSGFKYNTSTSRLRDNLNTVKEVVLGCAIAQDTYRLSMKPDVMTGFFTNAASMTASRIYELAGQVLLGQRHLVKLKISSEYVFRGCDMVDIVSNNPQLAEFTLDRISLAPGLSPPPGPAVLWHHVFEQLSQLESLEYYYFRDLMYNYTDWEWRIPGGGGVEDLDLVVVINSDTSGRRLIGSHVKEDMVTLLKLRDHVLKIREGRKKGTGKALLKDFVSVYVDGNEGVDI